MPQRMRLSIPLVEASMKGSHQRPSAIVLRMSDTTSTQGAAFGLAKHWHSPMFQGDPAHYVVDETFTYRCVNDRVVIPGMERGGISVMICAEPTRHMSDWSAPSRSHTLNHVAHLVADLILEYRIPVQYLDGEAYQSWSRWRRPRRGGIIDDLVGSWPKEEFLSAVDSYFH